MCTQWTIISRYNSTSVISSSSWTRRIAKPRLKFAARMVFQETFLRIHMRHLRQFIHECSITWIEFSFTGNIPVQVSAGKTVIENGDQDNNRSWAKWQKKSQTVTQFSVLKRWKNNWRKVSRGRTVRAIHLKTISTAVLAWMVIAQLHLPVNPVKSVLGCTIRPMNNRARSRSENCAKQSDWNSVVTLNVHDAWLSMLQDDEPPKSSRRPRKGTKSWDQWSVQKFTKVTQSRNQVHREGKLVLPSPVASMMYQNSRRTSREKTWVQSTENLNENWDAISLVFSQRRI